MKLYVSFHTSLYFHFQEHLVISDLNADCIGKEEMLNSITKIDVVEVSA